MNLNARSFLFIFLMTFLFFGVTWFFDGGKKKPATEQVVVDELAGRTAKLSDLPMARLYRDEGGKEFATLAVEDQGFYVTTRWVSDTPEELYVMQNGGYRKVHLARQDNYGVIFSSNASSMPIVALPTLGINDVQVLELIDSNQNGHVFVGEYSSGQIAFPGGKPRADSVVLYQTSNGYLPMGTYSAKKGFSSFENNAVFKDIVAVQVPASADPGLARSESFYVLENAYAQVVFSNVGGAVAEINLPFSNHDDKSIVLPIEVDRQIEEQSPANALFPSQSARGASGTVTPQEGGYYPLLRRGIFAPGGKPVIEVPPRYYALNVVSNDPDVARTTYRMTQMGSDFIEFEGVSGGRRITKRYVLNDVPYTLDLDVSIDGDASGLWLTSGVPDVEIISNRAAPELKYRGRTGERVSVEKIKLPKNATTISSINPDWVCNSNGFFGMILDPLTYKPTSLQGSMVPGIVDPTRLMTIDDSKLYPAAKYPGYEAMIPMKSGKNSYRFYSGPFDRNLLSKVDEILTQTGPNPEYVEAWSFHGWFSFISEPFAKFLFMVMQGFYALTGSWGFSIILLTIVLRLILYPLNAWSTKSSIRMKQLQPQIAELQKKAKKDPKKGQLELMQFYRENKLNPFTGGCLPLLIQMPFLIGMLDLLKSAFALRGVSFIPGWIDNLTAPDVLFSWSTPIPFIGTSFHLLPLLLGGTMFLTQKMMAGKTPISDDDEKAKQAKTMGNVAAIVFTVIFYHFPSGLNLYWLSSSLLALAQQKWMLSRAPAAPAVEVISDKPTKRLKKRRQ